MNLIRLADIRETTEWILWRGEAPINKRRFTVKQVNPSATDRNKLLARLYEEHQAFSKWDHPHLLKSVELDAPQGRALFEDTLGSIHQWVEERQQTLSPQQVAKIMVECAEALEYLHERQLGHGTLNLHSLLVVPDGRIRIGGFLPFSFVQPRPYSVQDGLRYQAPERLDGTGIVGTPQGDLYNLGFMALEMLMGNQFGTLFDLQSPEQLSAVEWLQWHRDPQLQLDDLSSFLPTTPKPLCDIISRLIPKAKHRRGYRFANDLASDLRRSGLMNDTALPIFRSATFPVLTTPAEVNLDEEDENLRKPHRRSRRKSPTEKEIEGALRLCYTIAGEEFTEEFYPGRVNLIGRVSPCDWVLPHSEISSKHAILVRNNQGQWWVYDLNSRTGVIRNDKKVAMAKLKNGDRLKIGRTDCEVILPDEVPETDDRVATKGVLKKHPRIGPFHLQELLHQGVSGNKLYRAIWVRDQSEKEVALRVFSSQFARDELQMRRFLRGIPIAGRIHHPNVVRLYRGGSFSVSSVRSWYLAMELMHGGSLRDKIQKSKTPMTVTEVLKFGMEITQALKMAEDNQLIHRNINPGCILFDAYGNAKLGDFVLLKGTVLDSIQQITTSNAAIDAQVYQSPEYIRGDKPTTILSDIYSLAACMFEALTLEPIFSSALSLTSLLKSIREQPVQPVHLCNPKVPRELEQLLLKALNKAPEDRFQSLEEWEAELCRLIA